jgi:hypothetical protein
LQTWQHSAPVSPPPALDPRLRSALSERGTGRNVKSVRRLPSVAQAFSSSPRARPIAR